MRRREPIRRKGVLRGAALLIQSILATAAVSNEQPAGSPALASFTVCYDFTCRTSEVVTLSQSQWQSVVHIFDGQPATPHEERLAVQKAVARMEQLAGFHTPTYRDLARNYTGDNDPVASLPGQMDCVDESINTTTYLKLFESRSLLRHHRVVERAYRRSLWNQHWAGQLEEIVSGARFVVDSWFFENGRQPYIVTSENWHDLSPFRRARADEAREDGRVDVVKSER